MVPPLRVRAGIALFTVGSLVALAQSPPPPATDAAQRAAAAVARGESWMERGELESAAAAFAEATRIDPGSANAWNLLGTARHAQKMWPQAAEAFRRVAELEPNVATAHANLGVASFEMQAFDQARAAFAAAVAVDAEHSRAHLYLARIAVARGDDAAAEREFALACSAPVVDPLAPLYRGLLHLQDRKLDLAEADFRRTLELEPDQHSAHLNLALVLQRRGRAEEAAEHLARYREITELSVGGVRVQQRVAFLLNAANREFEAGNAPAALALCLRAADLSPDAPVVHMFLARAYRSLGRTEESERAAARYRALAPPEPSK